MNDSEAHFNAIARDYDFWKKKNWYYYQNLVALYQYLIPPGATVLEIGCGTGDVLARLEPRAGVGIDISAEMVAIARKKYDAHPRLQFVREDIFDSNELFSQQVIFLADVLEHVPDLALFLRQLAKRTSPDNTIIISVANPLWEPVLVLAEKLGKKMPEGPHQRIQVGEVKKLFKSAGFTVAETGYRLLLPKKIWGSDWLNRRFYHWPFLRQLGLIVFWVLRKKLYNN